jgi:hypothetical protein
MMIIGCDLHTRYQQIAMMDTETGELAGEWPSLFVTADFHFRTDPATTGFVGSCEG